MRLGCGCGCLTLGLIGLLVGVLFWLGSGAFDEPATQHEVGTPAEGHRAKQKLFGLAAAAAPANRRGDRRIGTTFSERELNAFLSRHHSGEGLPLAETGIRLVGDGLIEVTGRMPLHAFLGDSLGAVVGLLPPRWAGTPVWLRLRGYVRLEAGAARGDRRRLRLDVKEVTLGRRRVPVTILSVLPEGRALRATRWPVPDTVDSVTVESGRFTITMRP